MNILFFDTETTSLYCGQICQLSYIQLSDHRIKAKNFYFKVRFVHPMAEQVHGLSVRKLEVLSKGKIFSDYAEEIKNDFDNADLLVAHNYSFDKRFIKKELTRCNLKFNDKRNLCTMNYFTDICKIPHYYFKYKKPKLNELASCLSISKNSILKNAYDLFNDINIDYHDARFDCTATFMCFLKANKYGYLELA